MRPNTLVVALPGGHGPRFWRTARTDTPVEIPDGGLGSRALNAPEYLRHKVFFRDRPPLRIGGSFPLRHFRHRGEVSNFLEEHARPRAGGPPSEGIAVVVVNPAFPALESANIAEGVRLWEETGRPVLSVRTARPHPITYWVPDRNKGRLIGLCQVRTDQWEKSSNFLTFEGKRLPVRRQDFPPVVQAIPALYVGPWVDWMRLDRAIRASSFEPLLLPPPACLNVLDEGERTYLQWRESRRVREAPDQAWRQPVSERTSSESHRLPFRSRPMGRGEDSTGAHTTEEGPALR